MRTSTALKNDVVITEEITLATAVLTRAAADPGSELKVMMPSGMPTTALITSWMRKARARAPSVGHHRPLTSW